MVRSRGKVDLNQPSLVDDLRQLGLSVAVTSSLGNGFPDIVVGRRNKNFLFEIKNPDVDKSHRALTPDEERFSTEWRGQYNVICTVRDVLDVLNNEPY